MTGDAPVMLPGLPLANILDAQGHRVTAEVTRSGLLVVRAWTTDGKLSGHPALNREHAAELRDALTAFIDGEPQP